MRLLWRAQPFSSTLSQLTLFCVYLRIATLPCVTIIIHWAVKVKWSRYRPGVGQSLGRGIALLFHERDTRRGWVVSSTPQPHFTPGKDPVPILQELGEPQGLSERAENLVPTGIWSRAVQPVVSRYTDCANRPTYTDQWIIIIKYIISLNILHQGWPYANPSGAKWFVKDSSEGRNSVYIYRKTGDWIN